MTLNEFETIEINAFKLSISKFKK
jgi:large subunit ribosomal protein L28